MSSISAQYVVVKKYNEPKKEGFQTVEPADNFVYKGEVVMLPDEPVYISNRQLLPGSIILFAKYSPDTFEVEDEQLHEGKVKFVKRSDILAVI